MCNYIKMKYDIKYYNHVNMNTYSYIWDNLV